MQDFSKHFYKSKAWQKCRDAFMESRHFVCDRCGRPAVIAHHRKYITPENISDPNVTLNWDNLECLCNDCHEREHHGKLPVISEGLKFDRQGNVVKSGDTPHHWAFNIGNGDRDSQPKTPERCAHNPYPKPNY